MEIILIVIFIIIGGLVLYVLYKNSKAKCVTHKLVINSLLALLCLFGCSDNSEDNTPKAGQYIFADGAITASIHIGKYSTVGITIFENGKCVYQDLNGSVSERLPYYLYIFSGIGLWHNSGKLVLKCESINRKEITATVEVNETAVNLPAAMPFHYNNKVLDINGDGVLDSWQ